MISLLRNGLRKAREEATQGYKYWDRPDAVVAATERGYLLGVKTAFDALVECDSEQVFKRVLDLMTEMRELSNSIQGNVNGDQSQTQSTTLESQERSQASS